MTLDHEFVYIKLLLKPNEVTNVFEYIQNGVVVTNLQSKVIYANPAFTRISGYSNQEILGQNPGILHSGRHNKAFYESMWAGINNNGYWEGEVWNRRKSGEIFPEYLTISRLASLHDNNAYFIGVFSDISNLKNDISEKMKYTLYDPLTELPNRTLYHDRVIDALTQCKTDHSLIHAIFFMDLDKFKSVNDTYGHLVGDQLLKEVAERLSSVIRTTDTVARVGGDEFTAMLYGIKDKSFADQTAKRMVEVIEKPFFINGKNIKISISIGICLYPSDANNIDELLDRADKAMYVAKKTQHKIHFN